METFKADIIRPFGPRMIKAQVPLHMVKALNDNCDSLLKSEKKRKEYDASDELVGHVSEELSCDAKLPELQEFFTRLAKLTESGEHAFVREKNVEPNYKKSNLHLFSSWYVRSFAGDYNPVHLHLTGEYSCVLYLKVPDSISNKNTRNVKKDFVTEGYIDFIYGLTTKLCLGNITFMPVVGDLYIFPSYLYHTVYPFFGEGERRSFSANFSLINKE